MNYFEFFNIPVSFQVDQDALRRRFYENSKKYHPDFHTLANAAQQADMLEKSTLNNEAYQTLSDPDRRMRYVLQLNGLLPEEGQQTVPQDFLLDMMAINEGLMELELDFDPDRYQTLLAELENLENTLLESIRPLLETSSETGPDKPALHAVLDYYFKKRYLLRIRENLSKFAPQ